jgi:hypothetical protein
MKVNGHNVPWAIVVFCIALIGNASVAYYKLDDLKKTSSDHEERIRDLERLFWGTYNE